MAKINYPRVLVLTTDTLHHAQFVRSLANGQTDLFVVVQEKENVPKYRTSHEFENVREEYESGLWFNNNLKRVCDFADCMTTSSINDSVGISTICHFNPDITFMFGGAKVSKDVIAACGINFFNFHGGDPELYRGLDSHLWAIWHGDFASLVTVMHLVEEKLDTGAVVFRRKLNLASANELHKLRAHSTELCVEMAISTLSQFDKKIGFQSKVQQKVGRYYSYMPTDLKEVCLRKYRSFVKDLQC